MTTMPAIEKTKLWIEKIVIEHNFCPFAARPFLENKINYKLVASDDFKDFECLFLDYCGQLSEHEDIPTGLLIFPEGLSDFETYLDLLDVCQGLIEYHDLEGVFQLASFHPYYRFAGVEADHVTNYTNRSPYPIIQLIKEDSITEVLKFFKNPEAIPEQNILKAESIGKEAFKIYL